MQTKLNSIHPKGRKFYTQHRRKAKVQNQNHWPSYPVTALGTCLVQYLHVIPEVFQF